MDTPTHLTGSLSMVAANINWRDETARCAGVFRGEEFGALEVEWTIHLDDEGMEVLARLFLQAGVPVLRGGKVSLPKLELRGDTLHEYFPAKKPVKIRGLGIAEDGLIATPKERIMTLKEEVQARKSRFDRRTKEGRAAYEAAERERLQREPARQANDNGHGTDTGISSEV